MKTLLFYLLQVIVTSGILYGYYHLALRNKRFHRYNRFYLLTATFLSIAVPFMNIPVYFTQSAADSSFVLETLTFISSAGADNSIVSVSQQETYSNWFTWENLSSVFYILIASLLLLRIVISLLKIRRIVKNNPVELLDKIRFINTTEPGTPYSFFRWLFWNKKIELHSEKGEQIFRHELFHIEQKHSWDTVYMELLTVVCWINPFFHLMKKELKAIHEFLADQFAVSENSKWQYAELLLMQALNTNQHLVNPFFHNQIKRRIAMITTSKKPGHQYFRKLMVLPVAAIVIALFAFSYKEKVNHERNNNDNLLRDEHINFEDTVTKPSVVKIAWNEDFPLPARKSPTTEQLKLWSDPKVYGVWLDNKRISNTDLIKYKPTDFGLYFVSKLERNALNYGKHYYQVDLMTNSYYDKKQQIPTSTKYLIINDTTKPLLGNRYNEYLIVIDGVINSDITANNLNEYISTDDLSFVNVLKGNTAVLKYGEKGKYGVIEIGTKKKTGTPPVNNIASGQIRLTSVATKDTTNKPLIVLDGQKKTESDDVLKKLDPAVVESINILKGPQAIEKYGEMGKNGVIEIITKKEKTQVVSDNTIFDRVEVDPSFPGGDLKWRQYLERNIDASVPEKKKAPDGVYTTVIQFIVDKEGNITDTKALTNHGYGMEEEALRVIKAGPRWNPAMQNGHIVKAYKKQPVTFQIYGVNKKNSEDLKTTGSMLPEVVVVDFTRTQQPMDKIFDKVEIPPHFPGGDSAWRRYLIKNCRVTTPVDSGAPAGIYKVIVQFIVKEDGNLEYIGAKTNYGYGMENEAIRLIKNGPPWVPAQQNGRNVRAYVQQPITFQVEEETDKTTLINTSFQGKQDELYVGVPNKLELRNSKYKLYNIARVISNGGRFVNQGSENLVVSPIVEGGIDITLYAFEGKKKINLGTFHFTAKALPEKMLSSIR